VKTVPTSPTHDPALLEKLSQPGIVGFFNHVEVTSVLATHKPDKRTVNVLTHLVTVERTELETSPSLLSIRFSKLSDWSFGLARHSLPLYALAGRLNDATHNKEWAEKKGSLWFGTLLYQGHWFAPPAGCLPDAPVNRLLKNNFWNGSHVWEWAAEDKSDFLHFFEKPQLLQALSDGIAPHLPIQLASLSDKLGHLVLQMPVTCLVSDYRGTGNADGGVICDVNWHPNVTPRSLIITAERWHDGRLSQSSTQLAGSNQVFLPAQDAPMGLKAVIRDQEHDVVLGAMEVNPINSIHVGMHVMHNDQRTFTLMPRSALASSEDAIQVGHEESIKVTSLQRSVTGNPNRFAHFDHTRKRLYREEMRALRERREFVQYRPDDRDENGHVLEKEERHRRALKDIRYLIEHHGQTAAWLWDPYLNATDVLNTLFYNPHAEADMRALTGAEQQKEGKPKLTKRDFLIAERNLLNKSAGNKEGLRLEFRAKVGDEGFAFHDRFLIFPHAEPEPLAWSLGFSVNGLGKEHHILQKVPNGRLVADAFQELWDDLNRPEHLVWKTP